MYYTQNDLVIKMRISRRIYNLGFALVAKSAFESHFPNSIIPGKRKIYSVKTFCSQQIWQIYITKYYSSTMNFRKWETILYKMPCFMFPKISFRISSYNCHWDTLLLQTLVAEAFKDQVAATSKRKWAVFDFV